MLINFSKEHVNWPPVAGAVLQVDVIPVHSSYWR